MWQRSPDGHAGRYAGAWGARSGLDARRADSHASSSSFTTSAEKITAIDLVADAAHLHDLEVVTPLSRASNEARSGG
jgi:hypothetical protein